MGGPYIGDYNLDPPDPVQMMCTECGELEEDCECEEEERDLIEVREYERGRAEDAAYDAWRDDNL